MKDRSAGGHDGAIVSGELHKERATTSLELDGIDAHVLIRADSCFGISNAVTATLCVRASDLRDNTVLFGIPHTNDSWTTPMFGMYLSGRRVVYGMWGEHGATKVLVESAAELPADTWTWLAATCDGATARLYVNGALSAEKPRRGDVVRNGQPLIEFFDARNRE